MKEEHRLVDKSNGPTNEHFLAPFALTNRRTERRQALWRLPIHKCAEYGSAACLRVLLNAGADPLAEDVSHPAVALPEDLAIDSPRPTYHYLHSWSTRLLLFCIDTFVARRRRSVGKKYFRHGSIPHISQVFDMDLL